MVPVVSPGPLVPIADFGPVDTARGWIVTGVITLLAAVTRFLILNSPTDAGTPIFDEKHYAPQAWQVLHNHGVEDNPGFGLVVHPPVGKQLIADRRGDLRLQRPGLAVHRRAARRDPGGAGDADCAADQPLDTGRRDRRAAADL